MQDLINNFGINGYLLIAQIINFLIILWILKRFAYKPILEMLEKRKKTIVEAQKNAEKTQKILEEAQQKEKELLKKAQNESKIILSDSKKQAEETINLAMEKAKIQAEKMLSDAHTQIEKDRQNIEKELALNVTRLASDMLKKSMENILDEKDEAKMIEQVLKNLKK